MLVLWLLYYRLPNNRQTQKSDYSYKGPTWVSSGPSANGAEDSSHTARLRTNFSLELDWKRPNIYIPLVDIQKVVAEWNTFRMYLLC